MSLLYPPFHVAVVGHSNVPIALPETTYVKFHIFRKSGAKIADIYNHPIFREFWDRSFDITFVLVGGNDVGHKPKSEIITNLKELYDTISNKDDTVVPCLLEYREPEGNHQVPSALYKIHHRAVNQNLKRGFKRKNTPYLDLGQKRFPTDRFRDGIHWSDYSRERLMFLILRQVKNLVNRDGRVYL